MELTNRILEIFMIFPSVRMISRNLFLTSPKISNILLYKV